jgi:hypothetical protein
MHRGANVADARPDLLIGDRHPMAHLQVYVVQRAG